MATWTRNRQPAEIALGEQRLRLYEDWLPPLEAEVLFKALQQALPWRQERIRLFGRVVPVPRLQCWIGDPGAIYRYSGLTLHPEPWPSWLTALREKAEAQAGTGFNSVLCNWYRDGADSMGWHSDDEPELGQDPIVASLTLGETRRFQFRRKGQSRMAQSVPLPHNSLLVMEAGVQAHWQHQLPKTRKALADRINLTFRLLLP